jgi:hypothetical protein
MNAHVQVQARPVSVRGAYMHTFTGRKYYPFDPRAEDVDIRHIAHSLATRCRYNGACKGFYSVAEHSCYVAAHGPAETALERLLHDGAEGYVSDLIRPLKYDPAFRAPFKKVEDLNERVVAERFGLVYPFPKDVKVADEAVTAAEVEQIIILDPNDEWESGKCHDDSVVAKVKIEGWDWRKAENIFLDLFWELWWERPNHAELEARFGAP